MKADFHACVRQENSVIFALVRRENFLESACRSHGGRRKIAIGLPAVFTDRASEPLGARQKKLGLVYAARPRFSSVFKRAE